MNRSNYVVFVSAGLISPKKRDHVLARRQLYLNYGALSLATKLHYLGHKTVLIHGDHMLPGQVLAEMKASGKFPSKYPLMLSIPSFYALSWAQQFCQLAKAADPDCKLVVGGRWVVGPDPAWLQTKLPEVDTLAPGLSEPYIVGFLNGNQILNHIEAPTPNFTLNHQLVENYSHYQPSIEASRGCGMGCMFCEERNIPIEKLVSPLNIAKSLSQIQEQYGGEKIHPYFQSSMFLPTSKWAASLAENTRRLDLDISWRTETRVDVMQTSTVESLAEAGLKILDLGLETASPKQILSMDKTDKPDRYLRKAEELLEACKKNGVMAKVNVLLYAGETESTLKETQDWLDHNSSNITGVSVGPVIAYGPPKTAEVLIKDWIVLGARPIDNNSADQTGITMMHLSKDIDSTEAESISLNLSRRYMNADDYFALKSFSYYPRNYSRSDFSRDIEASEKNNLPFSTQNK
ncbi:B12-binding domain-containing radical SAM protein [Vreelandella sp. 2A-K22]